jgi:hypothetical protein
MGLLSGWSIPIHGNYVGPGFTGGVRHPGNVGNYNVLPVDALDAIARLHDYRYEKGSSIAKADAAMASACYKLWQKQGGALELLSAMTMYLKSKVSSDNGVPLVDFPSEQGRHRPHLVKRNRFQRNRVRQWQ